MAILATCQNCQKAIPCRDEFAGQTKKCPYCKQPLLIEGPRVPNHDVFISYSVTDKHIAEAICAKLETHKIRCWMAPRDVRPGETWASAIMGAVEDSRVMVLVFSDSANRSKHVLREVDAAVNHGVIVIPFRVENVPLSRELEYLIAVSHWLDAVSPPLEAHLEILWKRVAALLAAPTHSEPVAITGTFDQRKTPAAMQPRRPFVRLTPKAIMSAALVAGLLVALTSYLVTSAPTTDGDSVRTLVEVEPKWRDAAQSVIAAINRRRHELLKGLPTIDIRTRAATSGSLARPAPLLSSEQLAKLPQRFVLSGLLGSIREMENSTWVLLWAGPIPLLQYYADSKGPSLVVVEFSGVQLAEALADYNANEAVRVVVERQGWGPRSAQPSQNASSPATNERRQFRRPGGKVVSYWCFKGLAIEKELQSRTCVIPELGRATVATNSQAVARSLNVVFRRLPTVYGQPFLVAAEYARTETRADGHTWAALVVRTRSEGPLVMLADLGTTRKLWEPAEFKQGDRVQASMTIRGEDPNFFAPVNNILLSNSALLSAWAYNGKLSLARQPDESDNQAEPYRMTNLAPDPLTTWTCIEGVASKIERESRPGEGSVSEPLQPPPKKSEQSKAKATDSLLEAPQSILQPKK